MKDVTVAIVGAGQAGLAASRELTREGIDHVVLERGRVGQTWRDRWDSFRLVTPNWSVRLPGHHYDGSEPDGFMARDEIVSYIERYARACGAPVREDVEVKTNDSEAQARLTAFAQGLRELGWSDDRNVRIDTRWAAGDADRFRRYAAELIALAPDVILASGGTGVGALQRVSRSVPIVFTQTADPVGAGYVG